MKKTSVVKKAQKGTSVKSVQKRMSSGVLHGHADNRTEAQRKAAAEFQGPNSTYGKRRASIIAQQEDEAMRNKTNRARKDESSYTYRLAFGDSPVVKKGNMYDFENPGKAGIAKKPNVSKPAATASKKPIKKAQLGTKADRLTKEQKQGLFNQSLVQGGSKNPAMNPEKYYPSLYGKGRVGDKPAGVKKAGASPKAKKGASVKKSSMGKCKYGC